MRLSRKIIIPTLLWFAILLIALIIGQRLTITVETRANESQTLDHFQQMFNDEIKTQSNLALGLANSIASNPVAAQALARSDRYTLLAQTRPVYQRLRTNFPIVEFQFYLPDGSAFLAVHRGKPEEATATSTSVVNAAIASQHNAAGPEIGAEGLAIRGVAPVFFNDNFVGVVEIALNMDINTLQNLKDRIGTDFQILLLNDALIAANAQSAAHFAGPVPALSGYATTLKQPLPPQTDLSSFYANVLAGTSQTTYIQTLESRQAVRAAPLRDNNDSIIGIVEIILDRSDIIQTQNQRLAITLGVLALALFLGGIGTAYSVTRTLAPIDILRTAAKSITEGELEQPIALETNDELGLLARAFNTISAHIRQVMDTLEHRVAERTRELEKRTTYLQATAEVARTAASQSDLDILLKRVALLIHERFHTYHTGIFLLDATGEHAVLQATAGQSSNEILTSGITLRVGTEGIVGHVIQTGVPRIARDISDDPFYKPNLLLPQTRAEIVLPLKVGNRILGALDMQSTDPEAFGSDELQILQILADQIAIAIENLRLIAENQAALEASRRLYGEVSRADWKRLLEARLLGYESDASGLHRLDTSQLPPPTADGLEIPIRVQEQVIGSIHAEKAPGESWLPEEQEILSSISTQIAYALESARLFNDLQERAHREQIITQIVSSMRETLDVDLILQNTLQEIGENMPFSALEIRLGTPPETPTEEKA